MDPQKITELANLLRNNGDKILNSEFTLTLSGALLRALNDSFTLIADTVDMCGPKSGGGDNFQVVKPINSKSPVFRDLQLVHDFVQKTTLLCIVHYAAEEYFEGTIDISKFRALKRLEIQKTNVTQIVGLQPLRSKLEHLICAKSLRNVDEVITRCGGDNANGFVWNELKIADFSYNNLQTVDSSLEFAQYLQHLNLRHNQLHSVDALKWLPHLKTLDLSYNRLTCIPQLHMEACKRVQSINLSNNFVEDLMGISKLDALTDFDLSDNCLMDHTYLLPLSALLTLKFLNLYGNPLYFHPKHRLATAQFLHKNTATVKFILDFEPLSKSEKAITGSQQMRPVGALNRFHSQSASISLGRPTPPGSMHTPASSVGSLRSFIFRESGGSSDLDISTSSAVSKKKSSKVRTVNIEEEQPQVPEGVEAFGSGTTLTEADTVKSNGAMTKSIIEVEQSTASEVLEAKKQIETFREKHGAAWLQSGVEEMMHSVLGIETSPSKKTTSVERNISRQLFNDYVGDFSTNPSTTDISTSDFSNAQASNHLPSSTPTEESTLVNTFEDEGVVSPIKSNKPSSDVEQDNTHYISLANSSEQTHYDSANSLEVTENQEQKIKGELEQIQEEARDVQYPFPSNHDEESEASEPEDDEETYIVYTVKPNEAVFLTISSTNLRERDTLTQRTKTKWSLKILESCDRLKSNTLRINFDTLRPDKQERIYTVEDGLCQELEKKLRNILSQRDLSEMNQTIYRCIQCACQFSIENKPKLRGQSSTEIQCPDCKSSFVAEIHNIPKSLEKTTPQESLSPADIVEEKPIGQPIVEELETGEMLGISKRRQWAGTDSDSTGKGRTKLQAINNAPSNRSLKKSHKSSANSLMESSSCSKVTANSQSSFDSNQSVVGSTNTDRDNEFKSNYESDVDILSNPSQSSIEVLDHISHSSRKTSEERRISLIPNLETIDDLSFNEARQNTSTEDIAEPRPATDGELAKAPLAQFQLTESSSSGSVTDSICTTYEQQGVKPVVQMGPEAVGNSKKSEKSLNGGMKKEDSGISSMFGALFQSTNILMSSSKKLIDAEASATIQTGTVLPKSAISATTSDACKPYKFNYSNFNEVDHRLKLYFYQTKFDEAGEHFKWIARGRIYNENACSHFMGVVVMSTCKCYVLEAFASENDDVTKWLRHVVSVTADRVECIQLLPWKMGLSFKLRDWGGFILILQDILRTDSLLLHFANNSLPSQCDLDYQPSEVIMKRLARAVVDEKLHMCALLDGCEVSCENAKRSFSVCGLLATDAHLYLTSQKLDWLSEAHGDDLELCVTQFMSNLVEVDREADNCFVINFLDETQGKCELWRCTFVTKENADSCLNAIGQSWEKLFGVPLTNGT